MSDVLVIGGGAAGMMAAVFAARAGGNVSLLEKNEKLGKKVYITGKGRCNLTNDCSTDEFLAQVPRNPRFLYSALSFFSPRDMMALLEQNGCPVTVQRGRRVFPSSEKASDVTRTLTSILRKLDVHIRLNAEVQRLTFRDSLVTGVVLTDGTCLSADAVVIACGGLSYPSTGSTGDGYRLAESAGHTIVPGQPVLVGLETVETWPQTLQGLNLRNVTLTLSSGNKVRWSELGEMLFTHYGVSGPLVLEASCHLPDPADSARLALDLKPGLSREQLDARLRRDFTEAGRKMLKSVLPGLLPASFAEIFPSLCRIDASLPCSQITASQRGVLLDCLKALPLTVKTPRPVDEAIVTRGGVSVKEIEPKSMRSRLIPNLYLAGEMIDVDAHTGGFNLQIAWSTGALAGQSAAESRES